MRIGLVSDTHGRFDPRLPELLAGCERILHAGDVMGAAVIEKLAAIAPTAAVRGNNDRDAFGATLPEVLVESVGELSVLVIHELGKPEKLLPAARQAIEQAAPQLVIYGHSHKPAIEVRDGRLYVNPGSCGPRRFSLPRSIAILDLRRNRARVELLDLEGSGRQSLLEPAEVAF
ncbi:metallophosphoesterase family protein [Vulgatibacter sp.]|uniref:metallophosphoesterase family protein n=1 Tax=Vulgatibacter sp. TaxID=1971226 RepID=UPI003566E807